MKSLAWMRPKLAELCEVTGPHWGHYDRGPYRGREVFGYWIGAERVGQEWTPDEDIAQAIRCMTAVDPGECSERLLIRSDTETTAHWECQLQFYDRTFKGKDTESPARAICLAIAAVLGWEEP